jgi:CheY-like chemotaxis protein
MTTNPKFGNAPSSRPGNTILIVDDDQEFREALAEWIRRDGFHVELAKTGLEALDKIRWGLRPCVILLDMRMEKMSGWDFRTEQKRDGTLAAIPVIAMSAGPWKEGDLANYAARMSKPIDPADLRARLDPFRLPPDGTDRPGVIGEMHG